MTHEEISVHAYRSGTCRSVDECASRLDRWLVSIGDLHPALRTWYKQGATRAQANKVIARSELRTLLAAGAFDRGQRDNGGPCQGYLFTAWNGRDDAAATVTVLCGGDGPAVMDSAGLSVFDIPVEELLAEWISRGRRLLEATVDAWEPDWARVATRYSSEGLPGGRPRPAAGLITYLSPRWTILPTLPDAVAVTRDPRGGLYLTLETKDRSEWPALAKAVTSAVSARDVSANPSLVD